MNNVGSDDKTALDQLLRVSRVLDKLKESSAWDVFGVEQPKTDAVLDAIKNDKLIVRRLRGKGRPKPRKTRRQLREEAKARRAKTNYYYENKKRPRRAAREAELLGSDRAEGWWSILSRKNASTWSRKEGWDITLEEWKEAIGSSLDTGVPVVLRYNTKKPWTLDNIYLMDTETRNVLWDGKEWSLRKAGYIL